MNCSERLQRIETGDNWMSDEELCERIRLLLGHSDITNDCMVDAYYYDFSMLPEIVREEFYIDMYLIFGISTNGEIISKWVERCDLDSRDPIINGVCIHPPYKVINCIMPPFNKELLSTPIPKFIFKKKEA